MIFTLETGYFIWNFSAWLRIFLLSAGAFCLLTYIIKRKTGGSLVNSKLTRGCDDRNAAGFFELKVSSFRGKVMQPWFDFPFSHILSIAVLFLLFAVALFSKSGVE